MANSQSVDSFSIIVLHYNQPRYVFTALDSVLNQNYENIELIFADDASTTINLEKIQAYIEEHKNNNIKTVIYSINEENQSDSNADVCHDNDGFGILLR